MASCGEPSARRAPTGDAPPLTAVTDGRGEVVTFSHPAERIVSLAPSCTETVAAVGGLDRLVAVTEHCDDPPEVLALRTSGAIEVVGGFDAPSVERLLQLRPDAVFASDITSAGTVARLRSVGLAVVVLNASGMDGVARDLLIAGEVMGTADAARQRVAAFNARRAAVRAAVADRPAPKVLLTFGERETFSAGSGTYLHQLIEEAGGRNLAAAAASPWPQLSLEFVAAQQPEFLLVTTDQPPGGQAVAAAPTTVLARYRAAPVWQTLPAVQTGNVYLLEADLFTTPGPRQVVALEALAQVLHAP